MNSDFLVIGAGHNGLACAAYLARTGASVLVLERFDRVGGACHTEEVTLPGFKHNICSVVHTHIPSSPVYRDLELERHGVRYVFPDHPRGTVFPDQRSIVMYREPDSDNYPKGPEVGASLPDFTLPDQNGKPVNYNQTRGNGKALVVFHRSARW